jgi:hypothetical protein
MQEIEEDLRTPKAPPEQPKKPSGAAAPPPPAPPSPRDQAIEIGESIVESSLNPLKLIKSAKIPLLSSEKRKRKETPLEFLVQVSFSCARAGCQDICLNIVVKLYVVHGCMVLGGSSDTMYEVEIRARF